MTMAATAGAAQISPTMPNPATAFHEGGVDHIPYRASHFVISHLP